MAAGMSRTSSRPVPTVSHNRLIASLSPHDYERLRAHLIVHKLPYRYRLYEANAPIDCVYFVETGVASLVNIMRNGDAAEVGTIGNEGIIGLPVVFGDHQAPHCVYMQVAGAGFKMKANLFRREMQRSASLQNAMLRYADAFFNQVAQTAACNIFHSLEQRCCRWLLMTHDRMRSNAFPLTQEFLAMMLGVRREGVSVVANTLKKSGLIDYSRGRITILDHARVVKQACECYEVSKREFHCLFAGFDKKRA
jgi:CRP-like cAMP-binding protein